MKTRMKTLTGILIILIGFFTANCKKGDTGPEGPPGSVNIFSKTFTVSTWASNSSFYYASLSVPELTSDVNSKGVVQVFFSSTTGSTWIAMPYTEVSSTNYFMNYATATGVVEPRWIYNGIGLCNDP